MNQPALIGSDQQRPPTVAETKAALEARYGTRPGFRFVKPNRCPSCKTWTLTGLDSDLGGFPTRVDLQPLSALGEALARLAGTRTHQLVWRGRGAALQRRTHWAITCWPAGSRVGVDVLAEHHCGAPAWPTCATQYPPPPETSDHPFEQCPF